MEILKCWNTRKGNLLACEKKNWYNTQCLFRRGSSWGRALRPPIWTWWRHPETDSCKSTYIRGSSLLLLNKKLQGSNPLGDRGVSVSQVTGFLPQSKGTHLGHRQIGYSKLTSWMCQCLFVFVCSTHPSDWQESTAGAMAEFKVEWITYRPSRQGGFDCESAFPGDELVCPFGQTSLYGSDDRWIVVYHVLQGWFSMGIYCYFHFYLERQRQILKGQQGPCCVYLGWWSIEDNDFWLNLLWLWS